MFKKNNNIIYQQKYSKKLLIKQHDAVIYK